MPYAIQPSMEYLNQVQGSPIAQIIKSAAEAQQNYKQARDHSMTVEKNKVDLYNTYRTAGASQDEAAKAVSRYGRFTAPSGQSLDERVKESQLKESEASTEYKKAAAARQRSLAKTSGAQGLRTNELQRRIKELEGSYDEDDIAEREYLIAELRNRSGFPNPPKPVEPPKEAAAPKSGGILTGIAGMISGALNKNKKPKLTLRGVRDQ